MSKKGKKAKKAPEGRHCALCGKVVAEEPREYVVGATGRVVCRDCVEISGKIMQLPQPPKEPQKSLASGTILTPQQIIRELDKTIIGQEQAKRAVAVAFWKQQLRANGDTTVPGSNLLLYGPTGCGKTALAQEAARIIGLPFISFDATTMPQISSKSMRGGSRTTRILLTALYFWTRSTSWRPEVTSPGLPIVGVRSIAF